MKTSTIVRKAFAAGNMVRDAGLKTPEDVQRFDNIVYGEDKVWQSLDVYRPKATNIEEKLPVIVSVHGGGWVYGDKERYRNMILFHNRFLPLLQECPKNELKEIADTLKATKELMLKVNSLRQQAGLSAIEN